MRTVMLVVGIAAAAGCASVSKEKYQAKEAEAAKYKAATQDQGNKITELQSNVSSLQSKVTSLEQQNSTLETHTSDLEQKLNESSAMKSEMQERAPVRLNERLLFKENSSKLTAETKRSLDSMAEAIARSRGKSVIVSGYTDATEATGDHASSKRWQLSSTRALEVAKYLTGRGVDPKVIGVAGFGEARPVAPNDTLANRAMNRRVEILLAPANPNLGTVDVKPAELGPKTK
jgi:chemotaxis protein MotB